MKMIFPEGEVSPGSLVIKQRLETALGKPLSKILEQGHHEAVAEMMALRRGDPEAVSRQEFGQAVVDSLKAGLAEKERRLAKLGRPLK